MSFKSTVRELPIVGPIASYLNRNLQRLKIFPGSKDYWEERYKGGGNSGAGSYSRLAQFKAEVLNKFVHDNDIQSVIEFGSGDGNQLVLAKYPKYLGFDVSSTILKRCGEMFANDGTKTFKLMEQYANDNAELTMSLDVIYHLVEDSVFEQYMHLLFSASLKYVVIYASNSDEYNARLAASHVRHRNFSKWVEANLPNWQLRKHILNKYQYSDSDPENTSFADFYFYSKADLSAL